MKTSTWKDDKYLYSSLGIIFLFLVWLISSLIIDNPIILPTPKATFLSLVSLLNLVTTYEIILFTLLRVLISVVFGVLIGIFLGVLASLYKWFYHFVNPLIRVMRVLPVASIILIVLIMFGQRGFSDLTFSPILVSLLLIVPLVFEEVYRSIINIDKDLIDVARLDARNKGALVFNAYLPLIFKNIETSIYQSIGLGIKVMVMAEYISQTQTSIGKALYDAKTFLDYDEVFAWTIILIVLCVLIEGITTKIIKRKEA